MRKVLENGSIVSKRKAESACGLTFHPLLLFLIFNNLHVSLCSERRDFFMSKNKTRAMAFSSLAIAISLVLRYVGVMIPFAGVGGMRINVSGFFSKLPALLFGPMAGAVSSGIIDILGLIIKPEGAYIPLLTVTAVLGGVIVGFLWKYSKNFSAEAFRKFFACTSVLIGIFAIFSFVNVIHFKNSAYSVFLAGLSEKRRSFFVYGVLAMFILCVIVYLSDILITRKRRDMSEKFIKLLFVLMCSNLIVTTLNTFVLRMFIPELSNIGFMVFYIPRLIEEIIVTIIQCYGVSLILGIIDKTKIL